MMNKRKKARCAKDMFFGLCLVFCIIILVLCSVQAYAHPGRTAADGCHYCRTNCGSWGVAHNQRHCHQNKGVPQPYEPIRSHRNGSSEVWEPYKVPKHDKSVVVNDSLGNQFIFYRSLSVGSIGEDVFHLQKYLNRKGFTVAGVGAGSPGNETHYFGQRTKQALIRYQNTHRDSILTPIGLVFGTGYFGPMTMRHVNSQ